MFEHHEWKEFAEGLGLDLPQVMQRLVGIGKQEYVDELLGGNSTIKDRIDMRWFGFALASLVLDEVENVLEIGTRRGPSTALLSKLFPEATIYTVDTKNPKRLAVNRPHSMHDHHNEVLSADHKLNLVRENIRVIRANSFFLSSLDLPEQFELVFVDGAHVFPQVAGDIMFGYNSVKVGGFLYMHDYYSPPGGGYDVHKVIDWMVDCVEETIFVLPHFTHSHRKFDDRKIACIVREEYP